MNDSKLFNEKKFLRNSKTDKHTGIRSHISDRWVTGHRHWRKTGKIQKKQHNIVRRRNANYNMKENSKYKANSKLSSKSYYQFV